MSWLEGILLGLVQGLTEFLPVSSSGHLFILQELLGVREEGILFEVTVHVATLVSVLCFYRQRVVALTLGALRGNRADWLYIAKLAVASLPAVVAVLTVGDFFEAQFESAPVVGLCLLLTGAVLWTTRRTLPHAHAPELTFTVALWIGCAQVAAILPGISRSGATIAAALALGVAPLAAAEFSFLMSVVAITGAAVLVLPELANVSASSAGPLIAGGVAALLAGVAAIWLFLRLLRARSFYRFAFYTWGVGALFLAWIFWA